MNHYQRHEMEDADSWKGHVDRWLEFQNDNGSSTNDNANANEQAPVLRHRHLKKKHHSHAHDNSNSAMNKDPAHLLEQKKEDEFWAQVKQSNLQAERKHAKKLIKRAKLMSELWAHPGIAQTTVHGLMIDAGSTGSRMHVYEFAPRELQTEHDVSQAVSGNKLSFPGTESRWTDRLQPGLATFGSIVDDDELKRAVAAYLQPLMNFAQTVLNTKQAMLGQYPIYLRATAGMRILDSHNRARVIQAVRELFHDKTYCPFSFVDEQARVLSGEEEAIYDWTGVNFLLGDLIHNSQGSGTVVAPRQTHGALDLGGGSTQISFYEPNEDIMANLFKLQIGQAKHWNLYAHSFLFYGMNEAIHRFHAHLAAGKSIEERVVEGIYNPCLPGGGTQVQIRTDIHMTTVTDSSSTAVETREYHQKYPSGNGFYQAVLRNDEARGNAEQCLELAKELLHLEKNDWCDFAHRGDCSLAGIYQPALPQRNGNGKNSFGEFVAFSNYYHIWQFLHLPERATIAQLLNATEYACNMSRDELVAFNDGVVADHDELDSYCFRSAYAVQLLRHGYGFALEDTIHAARVLKGQKVGWALGAMLYEINTMPWTYVKDDDDKHGKFLTGTDSRQSHQMASVAFIGIVVASAVALLLMFLRRSRPQQTRNRSSYEPIKEVAL